MLVLKSITNTSALLLCFYVATRFVVYRILWTLFDTLCVSGTDDISESGGNEVNTETVQFSVNWRNTAAGYRFTGYLYILSDCQYFL